MDINLGLSALATGTVDVITATYSPAPTLVDKKILFLRTSGANTTTTPTFSPNGLTAYVITKNGGDALVVGDLDGDVTLMYDSANTRWELLTPKSATFTQDQLNALSPVFANNPTAGTPFVTTLDLAGYEPLLGFTPEDVSNKSTTLSADQSSDTKYPSVKSVFDWAMSVFTTASAVATQITTALSSYSNTATSNAYADAKVADAINNGTTTIAPSQNAVFDALALKLSKSSSIQFGHTALSPVDSTNYFFAPTGLSAQGAVSGGVRRMTSTMTGVVTRVSLQVGVATVLGTTEQSTIKLNNKTAGTSVTLFTTVQYDQSGQVYALTLGTPFAVTQNDSLEIEVNTPVWVTNPTGVTHYLVADIDAF
jgi:hypothetical protein